MTHIPVLLNEVIENLNPQPGQKFIDGTINGGGHGLSIAEKLRPEGKLLGIEWDPELYKSLKFLISKSEILNGIVLVNDSYANLKNIATVNGFMEADGILLDLGMSSWHLEESGKGFSFQRDELLDMRYAANSQGLGAESQTAAELINSAREDELTKILAEYGEEKFASQIAKAIITARKQKVITSTFQLVEIIKSVVPFWYRAGRRTHFATKTFQALRIAVNHELDNVTEGIKQAIETLKSGGRLAVITFHSLEDRIVKNYFKSQTKITINLVNKKAIQASYQEIQQNRRTRSAKLRVVQKI